MKKRFWLKRSKKELLIDVLIFGAAAVILLVAGVLVWLSTLQIPDLSSFENRRVMQSTKIYDRTGQVMLYDLHQDVRRTVVDFDKISPYLKNATVAIEDDQFYNHHGIDLKAIGRAFVSNILSRELGQGGSTITQQVIKNSLLDRDKTFTRKAKEAILALKLEQMKSKDEILNIYLNESPYGGTIYGAEEAARAFFNKSVNEISLAQAAYLAAIPQAPTYLSPYGNHKDELDARQKLVLQKMREQGYITVDEYESAKTEEVTFSPQIVGGIKAPHFVMYIRELLAEKYGEEALAERGLKVITTLDYDLQQKAEEIVKEKAAINTAKFNASNAGLVATDPKTGDLLVMVGSRDYFSTDVDGNYNIALADRQPGSSIKPFIYATAFKKGYLPTTVLFDVKTQFSTNCEPYDLSSNEGCYSPNNHDNRFAGPISMRNALAQSLNIPAVKTLYLAGIRDSLKTAADMGITTLNNPDRYGLTLVLGGGEVKLLDMTNAYGVFANKGIKAEPRSILKVEDSQGNVLEDNSQVKESRVLDENVTNMISDILSDDAARAPLWGSRSVVYFANYDVAVKSGSTNDFRDAWIMGYAPNLAVGAWCGNNDNSPMKGLSGLITTPMWRAFIEYALEKREKESFTQPYIPTNVKPIIAGNYVNAQDLLNTVNSTSSDKQLKLSDLYNSIHSELFYINRLDPLGPPPSNPNSDGQFKYWEYGVERWKEQTFGALIGSSTPISTASTSAEQETVKTPETNRN